MGKIATVIGRFYSMDRDQRWDRVEQAYNLMVDGAAEFTASDPLNALQAAYERDENDEFVQATSIVEEGASAATIEDGDALIFMNFDPIERGKFPMPSSIKSLMDLSATVYLN